MDIMNLTTAMPGAFAQGLIWGIMAIGVYITFRILDIADLTVDGTLCTGGAVCIMMMQSGHSVWVSLLWAFVAGLLAGMVTGILYTFMGIPAILAGILTQLGLFSINLKIMGKANQAINVDQFDLLVSLRYIKGVPLLQNTLFIVALIIIILIGVLYWFFGTELGAAIRATGCNAAMARAQGINTGLNRVIGLMLSNAIFGKIFRKFGLKLLSVAFGAIIYYIVLQIVIWMGIDTDLLKLLSAVVVAIFLSIPTMKSKYFSKPVITGGMSNVRN